MSCALDEEDVSCAVCLCVFTEPVTLPCGHSFCRGCVTALPTVQCPQCRAVFPAGERLITNHILQSLAHKAKARGPHRSQEPGQDKIQDPEMFLKCWSEGQSGAASEDFFKERSAGLSVVQTPLFQGPLFTHLQFFMWKELLQIVNPKPAPVKLRDGYPNLTVSEDKTSFHCAPQSSRPVQSGFGTRIHDSRQRSSGLSFGNSVQSGFQTTNAKVPQSSRPVQSLFGSMAHDQPAFGFGALMQSQFQPTHVNVPQTFSLLSSDEFSSGQHYWEVEVGRRSYWCMGVKDYFLKFENQKYFYCKPGVCCDAGVDVVLSRVGVYLDCSSQSLSFYDADSMDHILALDCTGLVLPVAAYFSVQEMEPDKCPIRIRHY